MTNAQFYVAIGVPFFTILLVWIGTTVSNRTALNDLRSEMLAMGVSIRAEMKMGFDAVNQRFDGVNQRIDGVNQRLDRLETRLDRIDNEIRIDHEHRISLLEERLAKAS